MLRISIDLWPHGDPTRAKNLGTIDIANDGSGTEGRGNYKVRLAKFGNPTHTWKTGAVTDFPRQSRGPYDLLLRALVAVVGDRNRRFVQYLEDELKAGREAANDPTTQREDQPIETAG